MKKLTLAAITLALCFATGFTCSKNAPQTATETTPNATSTTAVDQSQMATPPTEAAPTTAVPADAVPAAAQPAVPSETK